jgi:peptidoglycan/xylan/chitin deacetylase (PgdA/CDA1 family)
MIWPLTVLQGKFRRILCFHSVCENTLSPQRFHAYLDTFEERGVRIIQTREDTSSQQDGASIVLTFDDGYKNNVVNLLPILQRRSLFATLFLVTGFLGRNTAEPCCAGSGLYAHHAMVDADDIRRWLDAGMLLGYHTHTHMVLSQTPKDKIREDFEHGVEVYDRLLSGYQQPRLFAYPFGRLPADRPWFEMLLRHYGFTQAYTTTWGDWEAGDSFYIPRVIIGNRDHPRKMFLKASGWLDPYHVLKERYERSILHTA